MPASPIHPRARALRALAPAVWLGAALGAGPVACDGADRAVAPPAAEPSPPAATLAPALLDAVTDLEERVLPALEARQRARVTAAVGELHAALAAQDAPRARRAAGALRAHLAALPPDAGADTPAVDVAVVALVADAVDAALAAPPATAPAGS